MTFIDSNAGTVTKIDWKLLGGSKITYRSEILGMNAFLSTQNGVPAD
jgi:hypothetical protein